MSAASRAEAIIALLGMQPKFTHEPPGCSRSNSTRGRPAADSARARGMPAWPAPIMAVSGSMCCMACNQRTVGGSGCRHDAVLRKRSSGKVKRDDAMAPNWNQITDENRGCCWRPLAIRCSSVSRAACPMADENIGQLDAVQTLGAIAVMIKPVLSDELLSCVEAAVGGAVEFCL